MSRILITGGAGFIGSHLADWFINQGNHVVIIDNLTSGNKRNIKSEAIFYERDITDINIEQIFEKEKFDYVFHHCAQINVVRSLENPIHDGMVNILGTINILECCRKYNVKKIIYASTAAVYGQPNYLGIDEKHEINPISFYGTSKYSAEKYIQTYKELYDLDFTILRYANAYGPRQNCHGEGSVICTFIDKVLRGEAPIIHGDGRQTRDFIFVKDIVKANDLVLTNGDNQVFNIGTGKSMSILELVETLQKLTGENINPIFYNVRKGDIRESWYECESANSGLDWQPKYSFEEGLKETIDYIKGNNITREPV